MSAETDVDRTPKAQPMLFAFADRLMIWIERLLALVLLCAIVLNFGNVIGRYIFGVTLISADELQIFGLVIITFLGAAIVTWRGQHLRMDVLVGSMPRAAQVAIRIAEGITGLVVIGFTVIQSSRYVGRVFTLDQRSDMAGIPMWIPHSAVLAGLTLAGLSLVLHAIASVRGRDGVAIRKPVEGTE